jgi:hypothetical protein
MAFLPSVSSVAAVRTTGTIKKPLITVAGTMDVRARSHAPYAQSGFRQH